MNILETNVQVLPLKYLHENKGQIEGVPANPRILKDDKYKALLESLSKDDLTGVLPLKIYKHGDEFVVLGGNMRLKALRELKGKEYAVSCVEIPEDTPVEVLRKIVVLDNSTFGEWDFDMLANEWDSDELKAWSVDVPEMETQDEEPTAQEDDFDEEKDKVETVCKKGDIWQLGNHRLMCGDSTLPEDVARLMDGEKAQMTFSDAPYNVDFKGSMSNTTKNGVLIKHKGANTRHDAIHNDKMDKQEFHDFMMRILSNIKENVIGAWYLSFSAGNLEELLNPLRESGMDWKSIIIWMKNQATLSMKDYKSRYEPIAYGRFNEDYFGKRGFEEDIWEYQRTLKNDLHPTMKPVPLISKMVTVSSKEGNIVLDLFGGSGSTLIACEQLGRKARVMELDEHYCDVIIARWEKLTGNKATLINNN